MEDKTSGAAPGDSGKQPQANPPPPEVEAIAVPAGGKTCSDCGTVNLPASLYCAKCGLKLTEIEATLKKICYGCNTANSPTSQYCYKCGLKLLDRLDADESSIIDPVGFWRRLAAFIIDLLLLGAVNSIIGMVIIYSIFGTSSNFANQLSFYIEHGRLSDSLLFYYWLSSLAQTVVGASYYTITIGKWGRTLGKAALRIKVIKSDGSRVGYWRAFARYWAFLLNWFTIGISFLIIVFNGKKQGLHDFICGTIVTKTY